MSIETEIRTRLVTASTPAAGRIYPLVLPQNPTLPAVTFSRVSGLRVHNLGGVSGRARPRISISSWASTYAGVQALAAAIRASLNGFKGTLATIAADIRIDNEIDLYEEEPKVYHIVQDYFVNHIET